MLSFERINIILALQMGNGILEEAKWTGGIYSRPVCARVACGLWVKEQLTIISTWEEAHREDLTEFFNSLDSISQTLKFES